jgi:hypothetical protein
MPIAKPVIFGLWPFLYNTKRPRRQFRRIMQAKIASFRGSWPLTFRPNQPDCWSLEPKKYGAQCTMQPHAAVIYVRFKNCQTCTRGISCREQKTKRQPRCILLSGIRYPPSRLRRYHPSFQRPCFRSPRLASARPHWC